MKKSMSFEQALDRLNAVVAELEAGELPLDQSLKLFSEGAELVTFCNEKLEQAKLKMETLFPQKPDQEDVDEPV